MSQVQNMPFFDEDIDEDIKETINMILEEYWKKENSTFGYVCREYFDECLNLDDYNPDYSVFAGRRDRILIFHSEDRYNEVTIVAMPNTEIALKLFEIVRELGKIFVLHFPHEKFAEFVEEASDSKFYEIEDLGLVFHVYEIVSL